jgi:hypothetical protein
MTASPAPAPRKHWWRHLSCLITVPAAGWSLGVIALSGPMNALRIAALAGLVLLLVAAAWKGGRMLTLLAALGAALVVALVVHPRNDREWAPDFGALAWGEVQGDTVTIHNYRYFEWRSETDFTPRWETRTFPLSALKHVDFMMAYWGSPHICHTMVSFDFGAHGNVCISVEARREPHERYSPLAGAFRRFELTYEIGDERDIVRVRTNFRHGDDVYMFRLVTTPEEARRQFLDYIKSANKLRENPAWYNTIVTNCTTTIRQHAQLQPGRLPYDWRVLLNGHVDEYLYEHGRLATGLPFDELKRRSHISPAAREASLENFSQAIRAGRPGF